MLKLAWILTATTAACSTDAGAHDARDRAWTTETALDAGTKLGGCVGGDLIEDSPGDEIAVVAGDGTAYVVRRAADRFESEIVARMAGEMIQCAVADVDAEHPGLELVVVGMQRGTEDDGGAGEAHVIRSTGDTWTQESLFVDSALIHGVAAGDVDPRRPGDEVLLVGYSLNATLVSGTAGAWTAETIAELPGPGKNAVLWNGGAVVACADGSLVHLMPEADGWASRTIREAEAGWARLGAGGPERGELLLAARDDGALVLFDGDGDGRIVHQEGDKLRGAVVADLDPRTDGPELATAGYERRATILTEGPSGWSTETVFEDEARFHHACAADVAGYGPTLFVCGYSGRLTAIRLGR